MISLSPTYARGLSYYHRRNSHLQIESSYIVQVEFTIPPTLTTGTYNVSVRTDYRNRVFELNRKDNNLRWILITIRERYSDLIITNTSILVESSSSGNLLRYSYTVQNQGGGPTIGAPWDDDLIISPTFNGRGTEMRVQSLRHGSNLPVGHTYQNNIISYLPQNTHGTLYLRLSVDYRQQIIEEDDVNNVVTSGAIVVPPLYADLAVQSLNIIHSGLVFGGGDVTLEWIVLNQGELAVQRLYWYDALVLSPRDQVNDGTKLADVMVFKGSNFMFQPQTTYQERRTVALPLELDYSLPYRIILQVNSRGHISENNRLENNFMEIDIPILPPPSPDLTVVGINFTYFPPGRILSVQWEVQNIGNSMTTTMNWRDQVFISSSSAFNPATSIILGQRDQSLRMHANQHYSLQGSFFISSSLSGQFYIFVVTDIYNSVREIDGEINNVLLASADSCSVMCLPNINLLPITQVPAIMLNITIDESVLPPRYLTGQTFTFQYVVENTGETALGTSSWVDGVYLSNVRSPSRTYLLNDAIPLTETLNMMPLSQGESYLVRLNVTLPHNVLGNQHLTALVDINNRLDVVVEGRSGIIVNIEQGPLPDLQVDAISMDSNVTSGQPATIHYNVSNVGEEAATGVWYEAVILSMDAEVDPFDIRLATVRNERELMVNDSYSQTIEVFIPYGLPTSFYYIFIVVDTRNDLGELKDNNMDDFTLFIMETVSTDIAIANVLVSPTNLTYGGILTYGYTLRNIGVLQARGYKCDSIYLSVDDAWDIADFEIGVPQCSSLSLRAFQNNVQNDKAFSRAAMVPFIANGGYYGLVRTRTNIRDPELDNNIGVTSSLIQLNAPILTLGRQTTITLAPGDVHLFQIPGVPAGQTLIANLAADDELHIYHDLYLRFKKAPTGAEHDAFSQFALSSDQRAVVRHSISGTYYLRVESFTNTQATSSYNVDILVRIAQFEIHRIFPMSAAPLGMVTLKISGTVISYFSHALLLNSTDDSVLEPTKMYWFDLETVYATFNITEMPLGNYTVRLTDEKSGKISQLNNSFAITMGVPGRLGIHIDTPRTLRVGETGDITVRLQNIGNTDLLPPHLVLLSSDNVQFKLSDQAGPIDFDNQLDFLGLPLEGPGGVLPPGSASVITFRAAQNTRQADNARFSVRIQSNLSAPHPYLSRKSSLRPPFMPQEVWEKIWTNFISLVGTTHASMLESFSEVALEFSLVGKKVHSVQDLVTYQLRVAYGLLSGIHNY